MRAGRLSAWAAALAMAAGAPASGSWALTMGTWVFNRTNDGEDAPYWR